MRKSTIVDKFLGKLARAGNEFYLLAGLVIFHGLTNFLFIEQDSSLLFKMTPHYYINLHLKMILHIVPAEKNDILFLSSWLLSKIFGPSLLVLRLSPTIMLLALIGIVYRLVTFLFDSKKTGVLAAYFVSFSPGIFLYSRVYSHQIFFICAVYLGMDCVVRCFLKGNKRYFILYLITLYVGSQMIKDASLGLLFLVYIASPLFFLGKYIKNKRFLSRYLYLWLFFMIMLAFKIFSLPDFNSLTVYHIPQGFQRFPYPATLTGWIYFFSCYTGEILNSVYLIPFLFFIIIYGYLLFLPLEEKRGQAIDRIDFICSLFFTFWMLNLLSKKEFFYIGPMLPLVGIISAAGIMLIVSSSARKIKIVVCILAVQLLYFFSFFYNYDIAAISGEKLLVHYNKELERFDEWKALAVNFCYPSASSQYVKIKESVYSRIESGQKITKNKLYADLRKHVWNEKKKEEGLAKLEYVLEHKLHEVSLNDSVT